MKSRYIFSAVTMSALALIVGSCTQKIAPPAAVLPVPEAKQLEWQKRETTAFIHFGLNTFNNREWGYGDSDPATFNPSKLDCSQWVKTLKAAGMKGIILTAKHHDGFCLWPTHLTDYCIRNTPYKNGKGDIVGELEKACREQGLEFAVYLSPWDRNHADYGTPAYVDYYYRQLDELLTGYGDLFEVWFDGANGGDGYYGGAKEKRTIDRSTYYNFPKIFEMVAQHQPNAVIFSDGGPGCRWVGNERGVAGETNWSFLRKNTVYPGYPRNYELTSGHADGDQWTPAECDVSIRPGWFWHEAENSKVKTPAQLTNLYYNSVGRNGLLLLNVPVNADGLISKEDSINVIAFRKNIEAELSDNLLRGMTATVSDCRGKGYEAKNMTDGNYDTYWATPDSVASGTVELVFDAPTKLNRLLLQEYIPLGQRVKSFSVSYETNGKLLPLPVNELTTTIGYKRLLRFRTVEADKLIITFNDARGPLCINNIEAFFADTEISNAAVYENAVAALPKSLPLTLTPGDKEETAKASDRNAKTVAYVEGNTVKLDLGEVRTVKAFYYVPDQSMTPAYIVSKYSIKVSETDNAGSAVEVASGEFSNIENNPIMQTLNLNSVKARYIYFNAVETVKGEGKMGIAEVAVQ